MANGFAVYRRPPGLGWLLALLAIPLLLGAVGCGILDKAADVEVSMPTVGPSVTLTAPTVTAPNVNVPALWFVACRSTGTATM